MPRSRVVAALICYAVLAGIAWQNFDGLLRSGLLFLFFALALKTVISVYRDR